MDMILHLMGLKDHEAVQALEPYQWTQDNQRLRATGIHMNKQQLGNAL